MRFRAGEAALVLSYWPDNAAFCEGGSCEKILYSEPTFSKKIELQHLTLQLSCTQLTNKINNMITSCYRPANANETRNESVT